MYTSQMRRWVVETLLVGFIALFATEAQATTILPNCGTCGNSNTTWDLTLTLLDDINNIYRLTVTATYGNPVDFAFVNAIAFKIDAFENHYDATPTVTGPPESGWAIMPGGISASGCSGSGSGFFCANSSGSGAAPAIGGTDVWTFLLDVNDGNGPFPNPFTSTGSFKAHFTDLEGVKTGSLLSEAITYGAPPADVSTPEPATLLLFGTGLAAIATAIRRRRKA
jgi:PEP-CTERM motif-containing protein